MLKKDDFVTPQWLAPGRGNGMGFYPRRLPGKNAFGISARHDGFVEATGDSRTACGKASRWLSQGAAGPPRHSRTRLSPDRQDEAIPWAPWPGMPDTFAVRAGGRCRVRTGREAWLSSCRYPRCALQPGNRRPETGGAGQGLPPCPGLCAATGGRIPPLRPDTGDKRRPASLFAGPGRRMHERAIRSRKRNRRDCALRGGSVMRSGRNRRCRRQDWTGRPTAGLPGSGLVAVFRTAP